MVARRFVGEMTRAHRGPKKGSSALAYPTFRLAQFYRTPSQEKLAGVLDAMVLRGAVPMCLAFLLNGKRGVFSLKNRDL
jgi:hypothetical protein